MKNIIFILLMFLSFSVFSQEADKEEKSADKSFEEILAPYLQKSLNSIEKGIDSSVTFIGNEAPIVIKQYIYFTAIKKWFYLLLAILLFTPIITHTFITKTEDKEDLKNNDWVWKKIGKDKWLINDKYSPFSTYGGYWLFKIIGIIAGTVMFTTNIFPAIKVTFFPKLYLLEQFIYLIK